MLAGYKTYILAGIAIIYAISAAVTGHIDWNTAVTMIQVALTGSALRSGINTAVQTGGKGI